MLHWLAGQRQTEGPTDPDTTGYLEPPETPAPVFAVRAFKHAIFGTPQTTQPKPRRNSTTENGRPRNGDSKPLRPGITRPKSASDAQTLAKQQVQDVPDPLASPTKGILLTPGTAAAKKKNVTFGDHVVDNEEKRPMKSGLPGDCPGNFPESETKVVEDVDSADEDAEKGRGRNKLNEALERARDDSKKRRPRIERRGKKDKVGVDDVPGEFAEPTAESGKYWKHEYDIYRTNTQREVKKLITKQKAAKSFAHAKDIQCTELADDLRHERKKVETLEAKIQELSSLMKDLHDELRTSKDAEKKSADEVGSVRRQLGLERKDSARPESSDGVAIAPLESKESAEQRISRENNKLQDDSVQRPSEPYPPQAERERAKPDLQSLRNRMRSKPENTQVKPSADDIWALSFGSSSPVATRTNDRPPVAPKHGRSVTSGTDATPLQTLDVNSLGNGRVSPRHSSPQSLDVEVKSQPDLEGVESGEGELERSESPERASEAQRSSMESDYRPKAGAKETSAQRAPAEGRTMTDMSIAVPSSSPFQPYARQLSPTKGVAPAGPREIPSTRTTQTGNTKENAPPASKLQGQQNELHLKPSAMWSSINAPQASKRTVSTNKKDGKEVSSDRLEAARARINARGRVTS
ncbi:hypothetical protein LTR37_008168 [Vermiconidia calcicola]|uniref:Uncharacterized protein n=1 Tax=Vermiconidia calcicola TaxID=1690605 RepID=A0ACC3NBG4_9PEZI|nr:hypothetical protein LTR37_008168 [Vermiconidia calcicola]